MSLFVTTPEEQEKRKKIFIDEHHVCYNDSLDMFYISSLPQSETSSEADSVFYLRKNGELHLSTYSTVVDEGYWTHWHEAMNFLDDWLRDNSI